MRKVRVIPKSTKMRQKVKQYGDVWISKGQQPDSRILIITTMPVHKGGHPYECWVSQQDCDLEVL